MRYAVRPFCRADAARVAALTLAAIRVTALRAYSDEQVEAWAARYSVQRLLDSAARGGVILVAADAGDMAAAYTVMEAQGHVEMLYCHPDHAGRGLGGRLLQEVELIARQRGIARLSAEASELARPVFARAGYTLLHRRDFAIASVNGEVAIHNYAMEKRIL